MCRVRGGGSTFLSLSSHQARPLGEAALFLPNVHPAPIAYSPTSRQVRNFRASSARALSRLPTMSPAAIFVAPVKSTDSKGFASSKGPALAIGSPATALDGTYQTTITDLEATRDVEKHMLDRLLDGGKSPARAFLC